MIKIVCNKPPVTGTFFNRVYQPLMALTRYYPDEFDVVIANDEGIAEATVGADVYFTCSPAGEAHLNVLKMLKEFNVKEVAEGLPKLHIVCDFDDAPYEMVPASIPQSWVNIGDKEYYVKFADGSTLNWIDKKTEINVYGVNYLFDIQRNLKTRASISEIRGLADAVSVTTDFLRGKYRSFNKNVSVLPNMIDFSLYKPQNNPDDTFRLGWVIAGSHYDDYAICKDTFISFLKGNEKARLVIMTQMEITAEEFGDVSGQVEIVPGVKITQGYHNMFSALNLDCGFAFVDDTEFNKCKSPLKMLEYGACGVPVLASNALYGDYVVDKENGFLFDGINELKNALYYVSKRKKLCKEVGLRAHKYVLDNYSDEVIIKKYYEFFKGLVK